MVWAINALGHPVDGDPVRWQGTFSSEVLPHGILACRAGVLNLLAEGVESGVREYSAIGAITQAWATRTPISVAYADVQVPAISVPVTDETVRKRTVFDLLVKMRDPGLTIAELEALADRGRLGRSAISTLLDLSSGGLRPTPSIEKLLAEIHAHRIY